MMRRYNKFAFSLIELMVVIAIVAVLSAIAVPSYIDYVTRANIIKGVQLLSAYKTSMSEFYYLKGRLPNVGETISFPIPLTVGSASPVSSGIPDFAQDIWLRYEGTSSTAMQIRLTFNANLFPGYIEGHRRIHLGVRVLNGELQFVCGRYTPGSSTNSDFGFTDLTLLPEGCNYDGVNSWLNYI